MRTRSCRLVEPPSASRFQAEAGRSLGPGTFVGVPGAIVGFITLVLASGPVIANPSDVARAGKPARKAKSVWRDLPSGLKESRKSSRPIILLYTSSGSSAATGGDRKGTAAGGSADRPSEKETVGPDLAATFETYLGTSLFKKTCRGFVLIRLGPDDLDRPYPVRLPERKVRAERRRKRKAPPPPASAARPPASVRETFVLPEEKSALLVLSFREQVVRRYRDKLPKKSVLRKKLDRVVKVNRVFAREDRRVSAILEKSLYAFEVGKRKAAVATVVAFESPKARGRMDDTLKARVDAVIKKYRNVAETEMKKGDLLDQRRKYKDALDTFEAVLQDFSFADIRKRAAIRKGEILRELQLFTGRRR